jgi:hypothetical protein
MPVPREPSTAKKPPERVRKDLRAVPLGRPAVELLGGYVALIFMVLDSFLDTEVIRLSSAIWSI